MGYDDIDTTRVVVDHHGDHLVLVIVVGPVAEIQVDTGIWTVGKACDLGQTDGFGTVG